MPGVLEEMKELLWRTGGVSRGKEGPVFVISRETQFCFLIHVCVQAFCFLIFKGTILRPYELAIEIGQQN